MGKFLCTYCKKEFSSRHSTAKYCSRSCAGKTNGKQNGSISSQPRYTEKELLNYLVSKATELGRTPSNKEIRISPDTYIRRFGSYNNAVIKAGLVPNVQYPKSFYEKDRQAVTLSLRYQILKRDEFRCQNCGGTPKEGYLLHVDHITPKSKGGKTDESNLTTLCWLCNEGKGSSN